MSACFVCSFLSLFCSISLSLSVDRLWVYLSTCFVYYLYVSFALYLFHYQLTILVLFVSLFCVFISASFTLYLCHYLLTILGLSTSLFCLFLSASFALYLFHYLLRILGLFVSLFCLIPVCLFCSISLSLSVDDPGFICHFVMSVPFLSLLLYISFIFC